MKGRTRSVCGWVVFTIAVTFASWFPASPRAIAQTSVQGQDAVYNSVGQITNSPAFIDASMFKSSEPDICAVLNGILSSTTTQYPATGAVVDARGLNSNNTNMKCSVSPWAGITSPLPSTILLPAGTIQIPGTWILPSNTRLIGEGENNPLSATPGTTIQATNVFSGSMIQFGSSSCCSSSPPCTGISVERLTLDGQAQAVNGIVNQYSQTNTRVAHVTIYQIRGTGLLISDTGASSASNSGPYTNIIFDTGGYPGLSTTACAQIWNANGLLTGTRGIHGLRCKSETQDANGGWPRPSSGG